MFWISLAAAAVLLWNIRRQGWTLPVLAIGLWAFVALAIGVIYPAISQALTVNPNQISKESPTSRATSPRPAPPTGSTT